MPFPALLYVESLAEAAPLVAVAVARPPLRGPRAWVLAWCALDVLESGVMLVLALHGVHNLWLPYLCDPISAALLLWAFSCWQVSDVSRLTIRLAIVPFLAVMAVLTVFFESTSFFSRAAQPVAALVVLYAAASTLIARSRVAASDLLSQDSFWVAAGIALYYGTLAMKGPISALLAGNVPLLMRAYEVQSALTVIGDLAIARGLTCPVTT